MGKTRRTILQKRIQHQHQLLFRLLRKVKKQGDKKSIHQLRVCLKSWQAFYDFCSYAHPSSKNSIQFPKNWKKLFRQLGKLREIQVTTSIIQHLKIKKEEKFILKRFFVLRKKKWKKRILLKLNRLKSESKKHLLAAALFLIRKKTKKLIELATQEFFQKHLLNPFHSGLRRNRYNNLHAKRTHLRKFIQLTSFFGLTKKSKQKIPLFEKINHVATKLGKWHDAQIVEKQIRKFYRETSNDIGSANKIKLIKITHQKERLLYWESQHLLRDFVYLHVKKSPLKFKNYLPLH